MKKEKELKILKKVYNSSDIIIEESEQPDFKIICDNETFGVEITEFYYNESTARLRNMDSYKDKILNSKDNSVLDKRDLGKLSRCQLYISTDNGKTCKFVTDFVSVKYDEKYEADILPKFEDIENLIINIDDTKNKKAIKYEHLDYLELFIQDMENISIENIKKILNSNKIINAIAKSHYERLYFISGNYLCVCGINPTKNIEKYNPGGSDNE